MVARSVLVVLALGAVPVAAAQTSASYHLSEHALNAGGDPRAGALASASYHLAFDALGDAALATSIASASYHADAGFVVAYRPPGEVQNLRFVSRVTLSWNPERYDYGINAQGAYPGGAGALLWDNAASGYAYVGLGDTGLLSSGNFQGGKFTNGNASQAIAILAYNRTGVDAESYASGENPGWFRDNFAGSYVAVGQAGYKVKGSGGVSFVQNDPTDASRQVVYTAPEGDEVAVYTRGVARLTNGEARVPLGETFAWVANPGLGLTAYLGARAPHADLYVESIDTKELVVKSGNPGAGDVTFDWMVWGLRIGFENRPVVQPKEHDAPIPNLYRDAEILAAHPELASFTARERHAAGRRAAGLAAADDARATALVQAIGTYDPQRDMPRRDDARVTVAEPTASGHAIVPGPPRGIPAEVPGAPAAVVPRTASVPAAVVAPAPTWAVSEPVTAGDLLVADASGALRRASLPGDVHVVGIASADSDSGRVTLADTLYPSVHADALAVPIRAGDLLVAGTLPGYVVRAPEDASPLAIVGRAMETLEIGTGVVRMARATR